MLVLNITGNAWGFREAQGGSHHAVSLGGTESSDKLAVTFTSSHVYTSLSMKSDVSLRSWGHIGVCENSRKANLPSLKPQRVGGLPPRALRNSFNEFWELATPPTPTPTPLPPWLSPLLNAGVIYVTCNPLTPSTLFHFVVPIALLYPGLYTSLCSLLSLLLFHFWFLF